ncbi:MAG: AraC family transcriptional regulator [Lachnospiraceae bacterium]|nr:AraC family transcriptional regulator [Lachnospiraceae bacterium]
MSSIYTKSPKNTFLFVKLIYIILLFVCGLFCITACFYTLSLNSTEKSQYEQIQDNCSITDSMISQELHDYLYSNLNRSITSVNTFSSFLKSKDSSSTFFQKIRIDLFDHYLLKQNILNDILLFRVYDESFVSATRAGYSLEATYSQQQQIQNINYSDLHELTALEPFSAPTLYLTATSHLYYIFPVYQQSHGNTAEYLGFAGLYINPANFFNIDSASSGNDNYGTSLILMNEEVLYVNGENVLSEKAILNIIDEFTGMNKNDSPSLTLNRNFVSTEYSFYYTYSDANNLTFLYYEPIVNPLSLLFNFENDLSQLYWIAVSILFIFFLLLFINKAYGMRKISHLYTESRYTTVNEEHFIFKNAIDLLSGNISPQMIDDTLCNILNIKQPDKYTSCIIIEPEPLTILKMTPEQKSDFMAEITVSLRMYSEVSSDTHLATINYPQNKITCIVNSNSFLPETLAHNMHEHLESVYNNCRFNVLCSTPSLLTSDLQRNYSILTHGLKYSYVYGYGNLFTQETLERFESSDDIIDPGLSSKIRQLFREHNFDELIQYIAGLPYVIRGKASAYSRIYDHYRSIFFVVNAFCTNNYTNYPYKDIPLSDLMRQFESIDEASAFLVDLINMLKNTPLSDERNQGNSIAKKFIDRIIEYIDENIVDASLNGVAEHFNVSAAHLSRVFKENAGINFSDYVAEKKLQKAVELLLDDSNYSIGDIAKALGYNTPAYFSRKFKERFELTPAMYRKQYMTDTK